MADLKRAAIAHSLPRNSCERKAPSPAGGAKNFKEIFVEEARRAEGLAGGQKSKVKNKEKVIGIIVQNPSVTIPEIAASLDMSIPGIEKIIRSLAFPEH